MDECKPIKTPIPTNGHLDLDEGGKSVDQTLYRSMIGSLLYLTASRPDIMFSVCMCARFQANPKEAHMVAVKRILRYLKHTPSIGLWYPKGAIFELVGYSNSIIPVAKLIEKVHPEDAICLVDHLCLGPPRKKIVWLCPPPKQNTLPRVLVVHKYFI